MPKKTCFCFNCESEYKIVYEGEEQLNFCPFCGASTEDADTDLEKDD